MASILTCYYKPKPGGFCLRLYRCINALLVQGHTVHYLSVEPFPIMHPNIHHHRFPWVSGLARGYLFWFCFFLLAPILLLYLGIRHRVTHIFAFSPSYGFLLRLLCFFWRRPLTIFARGDAINHYRLKGYPRLILWIESLFEGIAIHNARLYSVSQTLLNRIKERHRIFKPSVYDVLPNDIPKVTASTTDDLARRNTLVVSCVGILEKLKNQEIILRAFSSTIHKHIKLRLYGTGPDEQFLKKLTKKLSIDQDVTFMGWVSPPDKIWHHTDVLLYPSLYEGAPNAVLEALAHNIPVIASDIPEHAEILPGDYLVKKDNLNDWTNCFNKIFSPPFNMLCKIRSSQQIFSEKLRFDWESKICGYILEKND